jgi:hypothetical protein
MTMRTDHIQDYEGRGYGPSRMDRLSLWLAGETGLGLLIIGFIATLVVAAFVLGINVGYDIAGAALERTTQEVLR